MRLVARMWTGLTELLDGSDTCKRQEETEVIREIRVGAGDRLAGVQVLGLEVSAVGGKDKTGFRLRGGRLAFSVASVLVTSPGARAAMWIFWVEGRPRGRICSMRPPEGDLMVASLLPKA